MPEKVSGHAHNDAQNADDDDACPQVEAEDLNDLDLERRRLMARNRAKLLALGIPVGLMELQDLVKKQATPAHAHPRPKKPRTEPVEPSRRSSRLAAGGGGAGDGSAGAEALLQLGDAGAAEKQHSATRRGSAMQLQEGDEDESGKLDELSAEEIAARAAELSNRQAAKLRELELEGLVDFNRDGAVFVVIGSTGNHYSVRLSDAGRRCQCIDCRIRKRDCKHIKLILNKLQIGKTPSKWYEAVERCFYASSAAAPAAGGASEPSTSQREGTEAPSGPPLTASEIPDPSHVSQPGKHIGTDDLGPGVGAGTEGGEKHGTDLGCSPKENMESGQGIGAGTGATAAGGEETGGGRKGRKGAAAAARVGGRGGSSGGRSRKRNATIGGAGAKHEGATEAANEEA